MRNRPVPRLRIGRRRTLGPPAAFSFSEAAVRTIVFGAAGQLARELCPRLAGDVVPLGRTDVDVSDTNRVRAVLTAHRPEMVVNCSAYNFVDKAEAERDAAMALNAWASTILQ